MPDWAGLSLRGILFQHYLETSPTELLKCLHTVLTSFTAWRSAYYLSHCIGTKTVVQSTWATVPQSQLYFLRLVSLGFLSKSNSSLSGFKLARKQEFIYTWAIKYMETYSLYLNFSPSIATWILVPESCQLKTTSLCYHFKAAVA